ncbi:MAG TPA: hypothetical protein VKX49_00160 [Bryobacteraceae bacterium]|nr:hypothetical protein [Bryobacteraceae bacterium]
MPFQVIKSVAVNLSADEWELYDLPGANIAATLLNSAVEKAVNEARSPQDVYIATQPVFDKFAGYGARDSEPMYHLRQLIRAKFGEAVE